MSSDHLLRRGAIAELDVSPAPSRSVSPAPPRSVSPVPRAYISSKNSSERLFTPDAYPYPADLIYDREAERREERARAIRERICQQLNVVEVDVEKGSHSRSSSSQLGATPTQRKGLAAYVAPALVVFGVLGLLILVIVLSTVFGKGGR